MNNQEQDTAKWHGPTLHTKNTLPSTHGDPPPASDSPLSTIQPEADSVGEIDWEHPGIHRGNLITCAGSERVTDRVCSIK